MNESTQPRQWSEGADVHLDLRGLAPPQPLVCILRLLHTLDRDTDLVVHLDRDPVMLYPELEALDRTALPVAGGPGEVRLRLGARRGMSVVTHSMDLPQGPA